MHEMRHRKGEQGDAVRRSTLTRTVVVLTLTAVLGVIGFLAAGSIASGATRTNATVSLYKTKLGMILVNSKRHSLYMFAKDRNGKSACSASCAKFWPPLLSQGKPTAGPGVKPSLIGTTRRGNATQVTYNKHPLYTFALDKQPAQTKGEGYLAFGAKWYAVSAKGTAILNGSATTTTTTTTGSTTTSTSCDYPPCP
jgi:predicted lipoprotein with Yx(FWY)xxD motif